jgi:hypothetical protein
VSIEQFGPDRPPPSWIPIVVVDVKHFLAHRTLHVRHDAWLVALTGSTVSDAIATVNPQRRLSRRHEPGTSSGAV